MPPITVTPILTSSGHLLLAPSNDAPALPDDLPHRLQESFAHAPGHGLLNLGLREVGTPLPPVFAFWRDFAARYVTALCTSSEISDNEPDVPHVARPPRDDLDSLVATAPPMGGGEYLSIEVLESLWDQIDVACRDERAHSTHSLQEYRPYILRRLKTDKTVIADLPDKTEMKAFCHLSPPQAALYQRAVEELTEALAAAEGMGRKGTVLSFLTRFKQICNHPSQWLGDAAWAEAASGKFTRLRELAEVVAAKQEKMLVFTQFRETTQPIATFLGSVFGREGLVLHGGTPVAKRKELVRQFQEDDLTPFFVLSLKAGGAGLNLTAASHVVHFDRRWNPAVENQATDRAFRIGQLRNVPGREPHWDDRYPHELMNPVPYRGVLVSRGIVGDHLFSGKYSSAQAMRFRRDGARKFLRLDGPRFKHMPIYGDSGAYSYVNEEKPPYTPAQVLEFYADAGFSHACSVDHIIFDFDREAGGRVEGSEKARYRSQITLDNAAEFLKLSKGLGPSFTPIGVAQGWSPSSIGAAAGKLEKMGYTYIAVGGLVPLRADDIHRCLTAVREKTSPNTKLHLLGFAKAEEIDDFVKYGIESFDSTSPLLRAFKDARSNYVLTDKGLEYYAAVRIPQALENVRLVRAAKEGKLHQETLVKLESKALEAVRGYDRKTVPLEDAVERVAEYGSLLAPDPAEGSPSRETLRKSIRAATRRTLAARPWAKCPCEICKAASIEVVIFRSSNRNKRRGFHNLGKQLREGYKLLDNFFGAVSTVFKDEWENHTPKSSRLVHGAGIQALGYVMELLVGRDGAQTKEQFIEGLSVLKGHTSWTTGSWRFSESDVVAWNRLENTSRHISALGQYLVSVVRRESKFKLVASDESGAERKRARR